MTVISVLLHRTLIVLRAGALALVPLLVCTAGNAQDADDDFEKFGVFDDTPLSDDLVLPDWFELSFLDLREDLRNATKAGKRGLIIYFGQKDCAYCKAHLENNWGNPHIVAYTRRYFEVVAVDVRGQQLVTGFDGSTYTEKEYSVRNRTNFTPSLLFYDADGKVALRLSGYHTPYQFRAALEYVADGHYGGESFREYLARADPALLVEAEELNVTGFFDQPPHALDRSRFEADRPLAVFFEQGNCHACDILHGGPLSDIAIYEQFERMQAVQLDMWSSTPVLTPDGQRVTAREWADQLGLFYAPTLIFFDERGKEIIRVDSVVWFYRLNNVLEFVLSGGYHEQRNFQRWRQEQRR